MPITDTSRAAQDVQIAIQRAQTGEQRLTMALEMSRLARELARAGIRNDHPDWPESRADRELLRLAFLPEPLPLNLR